MSHQVRWKRVTKRIVAWVLVRYDFPGRRLLDAIVDLPFALPTAVAGIALAALYAKNGWIGSLLDPLGIKVAFTPLGIVIALIFIGLPFVVRTVQPVLEDLHQEFEAAAATLGANRWQTFTKVIFPVLTPALLQSPASALFRGDTALLASGTINFAQGEFVMLPAFALWLKLAYLDRRLRYTEHLVFALHLHAFGFLMLALMLPGIGWLSIETIRSPRAIPRASE